MVVQPYEWKYSFGGQDRLLPHVIFDHVLFQTPRYAKLPRNWQAGSRLREVWRRRLPCRNRSHRRAQRFFVGRLAYGLHMFQQRRRLRVCLRAKRASLKRQQDQAPQLRRPQRTATDGFSRAFGLAHLEALGMTNRRFEKHRRIRFPQSERESQGVFQEPMGKAAEGGVAAAT